jgi:hypothetical protein
MLPRPLPTVYLPELFTVTTPISQLVQIIEIGYSGYKGCYAFKIRIFIPIFIAQKNTSYFHVKTFWNGETFLTSLNLAMATFDWSGGEIVPYK